ncbi:hypothetical protein Dcar01_03540 [Deinococcus carri]|uniref:Portal protein n=1 Tax=Deinococcus carri TaxID=1211323 RepID=A0ABP9WBS7_9DEIO
MQGGWQLTGGIGGQITLPQQARLLGTLSRADTQRAAVVMWYLNPLLYGAVEVIKGFVLGASISYGAHPDKAVQAVMEEFWAANSFDALIERWFTEHLLLGENLTIWPDPKRFKRLDQAARIGHYGVIDGQLKFNTVPGLPDVVESIGISRRTLQRGEFVWTASDAILNDVRGWPVVGRALGPALAYVNFVNARTKVHDLASRINAIYYAFAKDEKELNQKAARFRNVPRSGAVLTLAQNAEGVSEKFEFSTPDVHATDAATDAKLIKQLLAVALGLPEHYLAEGGGVTRTTADSMGEPTRKGFERRQRVVWNWLQGSFRTELARRYPDGTFVTKKGSRKRVPASLVEFPFSFPSLRNEDLPALVAKVALAAKNRLASRETLTGELGYDPALEKERFASEEAEDAKDPGNRPKPGDDPTAGQ